MVGVGAAMQDASSFTRVVADEFVDDEAAPGSGDAAGDAEVEAAHRVRIGERGRLERARVEQDVDGVALLRCRGFEAVAGHLLDEDIDGVRSRVGRVDVTARRSAGTFTDHDR